MEKSSHKLQCSDGDTSFPFLFPYKDTFEDGKELGLVQFNQSNTS